MYPVLVPLEAEIETSDPPKSDVVVAFDAGSFSLHGLDLVAFREKGSPVELAGSHSEGGVVRLLWIKGRTRYGRPGLIAKARMKPPRFYEACLAGRLKWRAAISSGELVALTVSVSE